CACCDRSSCRRPIDRYTIAGLIEIERFHELERDLIADPEFLRGIGKRDERMGSESQMHMVLVAEMLEPVHLRAGPGTIGREDPDVLGAQTHRTRLRRQ